MDLRRRHFERAYRRKKTTWDTGVTPPEVVAFIEGAPPPPAGRALDLGCGTGTNALYLARHGWEVVGVDFSHLAIAEAQRKGKAAAVTGVSFHRANVTALSSAGITGFFDFVLDIGCFHGVVLSQREAYVREVSAHTQAGAMMMIFAWGPTLRLPGHRSTREGEIRRRFGRAFELMRVEPGKEPAGAAWFSLQRR